MIRELHISGYSSGDELRDGQMTEPPEQIINLTVIGGVAVLDIQKLDDSGKLADVEATIRVPAKSLVRAVQALIDDEG